jgi:hypothetical protein
MFVPKSAPLQKGRTRGLAYSIIIHFLKILHHLPAAARFRIQKQAPRRTRFKPGMDGSHPGYASVADYVRFHFSLRDQTTGRGMEALAELRVWM